MKKLLLRLQKFVYSGIFPGAILISTLMAVPAVAAPSLTVTNNIFLKDVQPGATYVHKMTITSGSSAPLDMQVEAAGLGTGLNGDVLALGPQDDTSPYSARSFISKIDKPSFRLNPGVPEEVQVTISIPQDVAPGERYADIHIFSQPTASESVSMVLAANVPIIAIVPGTALLKTGEITDLKVSATESGGLVEVTTIFKNTGAARLKVNNQVSITDVSGQRVLQSESPVAMPSIIPAFSRLFSYDASAKELAAGQYFVESKIVLDDGTVLDVEKINFTVAPADSIKNSLPETSVPSGKVAESTTSPENSTPTVSWYLAGSIIGALLLTGVILAVLLLRTAAKKNS